MKLMIGTKLIGAFMIVALICGIVGFVGYSGMNQAMTQMDILKDDCLPSTRCLLTIDGAAEGIDGAIGTIMNPELSAADVQALQEKLTDLRERYQTAWKNYESLPQSTEDKAAWDKFVSAWEQWLADNNATMQLLNSRGSSLVKGTNALHDAWVKADKDGDIAMEHLDKLQEINNSAADEASKHADSVISGMTTTVVISVIVGVLLAIGLGFVISRSISRPVTSISKIADAVSVGDIDHTIDIRSQDEIGMLAESFRRLIEYMKTLAGAAERIAANDLTVTIHAKSEKDVLGNAFKTMTTNLTAMIRQLTDNSTQLVSAATEIASSSEQMARGSQEQTGQTSQVSSAVEEMTATIVESSKNAGEAAGQAKEAANAARAGNQVVTQTIEGMNRIAQVVQESAKTVQELAKSSDKIGEIIGVIDDIADQTNLLALNAAIEAARAGEQGRGFAVVADEVRKLAERTGKATKEITDMIKGIQNDTKGAVAGMEQGINEVQQGRDLADKAGESLTAIATYSQKVMDMIQQIATAAEEQSAASEQIARSVEGIARVTKENATGVEQSAAAAEQLNRQAEGLQKMVGRFKVNA
ncbi:MAG: methyl-accepting chemotaxis protein [candidate division Zixibacteria bacterium]|nr:methyl-accepting chemotaxis protein [candidate division Zixibacteria bacterium]